MASFQKGTIVLSPVRLKSSSIKSSVTSQKYSCPGNEQNQLIHVSVDVGVDEAEISQILVRLSYMKDKVDRRDTR